MKKPFSIDTEIVGKSATKTDDNPMPEGACDSDDINIMLDDLLVDRPWNEFLQSLLHWYEEKNWLTRKQYDALKRMHEEL